MTASVLGLDIGGANLKAAHTSGAAALQPFALWKQQQNLADALRLLLERLPACESLAVTMTGELCDCFATKRQGVEAILDAVAAVAGSRRVVVWRTDACFVDLAAARATPLLTAATNWHALATYAARYAGMAPGLIVDVGSTTTDIEPVVAGKPVPTGRTDPERLRSRELVYTGVRRTPLCALLGPAAAAEWFATTLDAYLILGEVPEDGADLETADGRPATVEAARARLARMLCADVETCPEADTRSLAVYVRARQAALLQDALSTVASRLPGAARAIVLAGSGEFLARRALQGHTALATVPVISLAEKLGTALSQAACAHALAVLASEMGI